MTTFLRRASARLRTYQKSSLSPVIFAATLISPAALADCRQDVAYSETENAILSAYIAYYGRPADPAGLQFWSELLEANAGDIHSIIDAFGVSTEYTERFGTLSNAELINNLYQQIFGRDADTVGLAFYQNLLDQGERTLQSISLDILNGAINDDKNVVNNRLLAAQHYATELRTGANPDVQIDAAALAGTLANVSSDVEQTHAVCLQFDTLIDSSQAPSSARYRVTFTTTWSEDLFPTNFPSNRHFSGLIGATHDDQVIFWEPGQLATPGIEDMAETGNKSAFTQEISTSIEAGNTEHILSGGGISSSSNQVSLEFNINRSFSSITLVSMVAPSPDWFVGVHNLPLYTSDGWIDTLTIALPVYDAGTDDGNRFTSLDSEPEPHQTIQRLTSEASDTDFVNGLHRQSAETVIGSFVFERLE